MWRAVAPRPRVLDEHRRVGVDEVEPVVGAKTRTLVITLISEAATNAGDIAGTISGVAQAADATATGATETEATAQELARMAASLHQTVSVYRV